MAALHASMIHDAPIDAEAVLALEQRARVEGTGLDAKALQGCWQLHQTWSRRGTAPPAISLTLLRALRACLVLEQREQNLTITNQVSLGPVRLRFDGTARLKGRRPLLNFQFSSMKLQIGSLTLLNQTLPTPAAQRQPFFALIAQGSERGWLCARGRGGGLAVWIRDASTTA